MGGRTGAENQGRSRDRAARCGAGEAYGSGVHETTLTRQWVGLPTLGNKALKECRCDL